MKENKWNGIVNTVKMVSDDINMEFGIDKCAKDTFKRSKKVSTEGIKLADNSVKQKLERETTYTYLGIEKGDGTEHHKMKVKTQKEYKRRIKLVFKCNSNHTIAAINTSTVPVVTYSNGVIELKLDNIQGLNMLTMKHPCMKRMHVMKADVDRIYLQYQDGGQGLVSLERKYSFRQY